MCLQKKNIKYVVVDLFCGAGGTATGFEKLPEFKEIACVNHDANAIKSHEMNLPDCEHYTEDITDVYGTVTNGFLFQSARFMHLVRLVDLYRAFYPGVKVILWASLECTNFSKAKGGMPRDADSRTLANHMDRYIIPISPDYIMIENVVEFMAWGPLDENGKPISRKNGKDFIRWCQHIDSLGYRNEWRELNSADFGAYQSRNRLFGCFAKSELPISWPSPTHSNNSSKVNSKYKAQNSLFDTMPELKPYKAVREVLDLTNEGKSIFDREKPLCDKTLERIYAGLVKFVAGGKDAFLVKYNSMSRTGKYIAPSMDEPSPVVSTQNRLALAKVKFGIQHNSGDPKGMVYDINKPARILTTHGGNQGVVNATFITSYYGNGGAHSVEEPCPTVSTHDRFSSVFVMRDFSSGMNWKSINEVCGTIMANPKLNLVTPVHFVMNTGFNNTPTSVDEPCTTVTANRKWQYIVNPQYGNGGNSVDAPCPTVIARQDKMPLSLLVAVGSEQSVAVRVDDNDSDVMIKIKEFMCMYGIVDIKMRMFMISELLQIQGFPVDYKLVGSQAEQKKFIGNAVHTVMPQVLGKCYL